ncbi:MAG TPA: YHS domain-containing protein, partial [Phenylobacterium sp.]|nr:YHS domain-containing protein [Phenylobacterium sp.]
MAHHHNHAHAQPDGDFDIDPVCGMKVDRKAQKPFAEYEGRTYRFCAQGCLTKFTADPARYLEPREPDPP